MANYSDCSQRLFQRADMPSLFSEGSLTSPINIMDDEGSREGSTTSPILIADDESEGEAKGASRVMPRVPRYQSATPAAAVRGGTCRFRGLALALIGQLFPNARFEIHRVGFPEMFDMSHTGGELAAMHALVDRQAVFRVAMAQCDTPAENEGPLVWARRHSLPGGLTADEYCNILKLGEPGLGRLILFTYCGRRDHSWGLVRQVPGRDYTLEDALNILQVDGDFRGEIQGFGAKLWANGERIPRLYICKDMSYGAVKSKITNIMRA